MTHAQIEPDIKRRHSNETLLAQLYVARKGRCEHCRKAIEHYLCAMRWIMEDGSERLIHRGHGHRCEREMIHGCLDRVSARRRAARAGR